MANAIGVPLRRIGSFSRWTKAKTTGERLFSVAFVLMRAVYCVLQIIFFFLAYFGFIIPILWAKKLWPRFYWFWEGQLYSWLQAFCAYWGMSYVDSFILIYPILSLQDTRLAIQVWFAYLLAIKIIYSVS
jgi:hypothetical protein